MTFDIPFSHVAPDGYFYSFEEYKTNVIRIWLNSNRKFVFNGGKPARSVWGFYSTKKNKYFAPVNSSKVGNEVDFKQTRNYTSMPIKSSPLDAFFV
jgi:hypothetical protein